MLQYVDMEITFLNSLILTLQNPNNTLDENVYMKQKQKLNSFLANVPILYLLKTPENLWSPSVFKEYKMGTFTRNGLSL